MNKGSINSTKQYGDEASGWSIRDLQDRLKRLEQTTATSPSGTNTLSGIPEPRFPFVVATRVDDDGKIWYTTAWNIPNTTYELKCSTHKIKGAIYGKRVHHEVEVDDGHRAAGTIDWEIGPFNPNKGYNVVKATAKLLSDAHDGGGTRAQNPTSDGAISTTPAQQPITTENPSLGPATGQAGNEVENEILNSKFKFSINAWDDAGMGDTTHLAKWRYGTGPADFRGGDQTKLIPDNTLTIAANYWGRTAHVFNGVTIRPGVAVLFQSTSQGNDFCARLQQRPFDAGEPFFFQGAFFVIPGSGLRPTTSVTVALEDSSAGQIAVTRIDNFNTRSDINRTWAFLRFPETTVSASYVPVAGSKQWVRVYLNSGSGPDRILMDKCSASHASGAYKPNPNDRMQDEPDVLDRGGVGRGTTGYGRSGIEVESTNFQPGPVLPVTS